MGREVNLGSTKTIEVVAATTETTSTVQLNHVTDDGTKVVAMLNFGGYTKEYVLWDSISTPTYAGIGQWTDDDVDNRLEEIL